jgi:hypothetical protein
VDITRVAAYSAYAVEAAVIQGFFGLAQASGLLPRYSESMPDIFNGVGKNYLTTDNVPNSCSSSDSAD